MKVKGIALLIVLVMSVLNSKPIKVKMNMKIHDMMEFNRIDGFFKIRLSLEMFWNSPTEDSNALFDTELPTALDYSEMKKRGFWLPDFHVLDAIEVDYEEGITRKRGPYNVIKEPSGNRIVVFMAHLILKMSCDFSDIDRYKLIKPTRDCFVKIGSDNKNKDKVKFVNMNTSVLKNYTCGNFKITGKSLKRKKDKIYKKKSVSGSGGEDEFSCDGTKLTFISQGERARLQYEVPLALLVFMALSAVVGFPNDIDRSGWYATILLGSILLYVDILSNRPNDHPLHDSAKYSIGMIVLCLACYTIIIKLTIAFVLGDAVRVRLELSCLFVLLALWVNLLIDGTLNPGRELYNIFKK